MSPLGYRTLVAAAVMLLAVQNAAQAQSLEALAAAIGTPAARVRGLDRDARQILQRAIEASPTVVRMLTALESSDLIVGVETAPLAKLLHGEARIVAETPTVRYLRVRLSVPNGEDDLIVVLGHELRHTLEIAGMPDVRDETSLVKVYQRIGTKGRGDGYYETDAALETGSAVARELAARRRPKAASTRAARRNGSENR